LIVYNHTQSKENRIDKYDYYSIHYRTILVDPGELPNEREDYTAQLNSLVQTLNQINISDGEDRVINGDEDRFIKLPEEDKDRLYSPPTPRIGLPRLPSFTPSFTSTYPSSVRCNDNNEIEVNPLPQTLSRFTRSRRLGLGTPSTSLLSSLIARLSTSTTSATELVSISPSTGIAGYIVIASTRGRRLLSRLYAARISSGRPSIQISTTNTALVNSRPTQKRLRASTI
jgi:hypothetical protein